jgi:hypothetical protein
LHQALVLFLHNADLLAELVALAAGISAAGTGASGEAGHVAGLGSDAVLRLGAGAELVALLVGGVNALAVAVAVHRFAALFGAAGAALLGLALTLCWTLALPLAASRPSSLSKCRGGSQHECGRNNKRSDFQVFPPRARRNLEWLSRGGAAERL